jgi:hypothetical protein
VDCGCFRKGVKDNKGEVLSDRRYDDADGSTDSGEGPEAAGCYLNSNGTSGVTVMSLRTFH